MVADGRRRVLDTAARAALALFLGGARDAFGSTDELDAAIRALGGDAEPGTDGTLRLAVPEVAENGNSVPVSFAVDSPMTADDHVEAVMILAPDNPVVRIATFTFTPAAGVAEVRTRVRLARTQELLAFARTSDGRLHRASTHVRVVIGGCGA